MDPNEQEVAQDGGAEWVENAGPPTPQPNVSFFPAWIPEYRESTSASPANNTTTTTNSSSTAVVSTNSNNNDDEDDDEDDDDMAERPTTPRQGGGQLPNGTGAALMVASGLPHAGFQQDVNHVYELLGELSDVLRQNREETQRVRETVTRISVRAAETGQQPSLQEVNTELAGGNQLNLHAQVAQLTAQVEDLALQRDKALKDVREMNECNDIYQDTMTTMMDKIRNFVYNKEMEVIAIHRKYNDEIQELKDANLEIRLEHSRWQEGLGRAMHNARMALRAVTDYESPYITERAELREENRMLRWQLNYERRYDDEAVDTDDEDEGGPTNTSAVPQNDGTSGEPEAPVLTEEPSTNDA